MKRNMKKTVINVVILAVLTLSGCGKDNTTDHSSYNGKIYDLSVNQDGSVTAQSKKVGNFYTLTISGTGDVKDFVRKEAAPWSAIAKKISEVKIENGIRNVGDYFFYSLTLSEYLLPESIIEVGEHSFNEGSIVYTYGGEITNISNDVYYYSETKPIQEGNYFHIIGDEPVVWILKSYKFLFIGNSFTYKGSNAGTELNPEVPLNFKKIAKSFDFDVETDAVVKGGHSLTNFANPSDEMGAVVETKLTSNQYDFVILQEQSTTPIDNPSIFETAVKSLKKRIGETQESCQVVLYETWGTPYNTSEDPKTYGVNVSDMEAKIRAVYTSVADVTGCLVNYIGKAFSHAYNNTTVNIYNDDGIHQNEYGAYLSAASHVRSIFNIKVSGTTEFCGLDQTKCKALLSVTDTVI